MTATVRGPLRDHLDYAKVLPSDRRLDGWGASQRCERGTGEWIVPRSTTRMMKCATQLAQSFCHLIVTRQNKLHEVIV